MPPDIMAGPLAPPGSAPLGGAVVAGSFAPPGSDTGLAALFAALLAHSGSPPSGLIQTVSALKVRGDDAKTETKKSSPSPKDKAPAQTDGTQTGNTPLPQWLPPILPIQMRPTTLPNAGVTAGKQNAMDTALVTASPNAKSVENGSGSELPLREAQTSKSRPLPAFPGFLSPASGASPTTPAVPSAAPSAPTLDSVTALPTVMPPANMAATTVAAFAVPAASGQSPAAAFRPRLLSLTMPALTAAPAATIAPAAEAVTALSSMSATPSVSAQIGMLVAANKPLVAALPSVSSSQASAKGMIAAAVILPTTFSLSAVNASPAAVTNVGTAPILPLPIPVPAPVSSAPEAGLREPVTTALGASPQVVSPSYVVTSQTILVPPAVLTGASHPVTTPALPTVAAMSAAPVPTGAASPDKALALPVRDPLPTQTDALTQAQAGQTTPAATQTVSIGLPHSDLPPVAILPSAPTVTAAPTALPTTSVAPTVVVTIVPLVTAQTVAAVPGTPTQTPLKTEAVPADNNTGLPMASDKNTVPATLRLQVIGKRSERRAELAKSEVVKSDMAASDTVAAAAMPLPGQMPAAPSDAAKTETPPLTRTERTEMVRQVADGIGAMRLPAKTGASEQMTLQLHPRDWGQLQVSIRVSSVPPSNPLQSAGGQPSQTVTAHIIAETPQVKTALENHSGELRATLREAGLTLDRLTVTVQAPGASGQSSETPGHHQTNGGQTNGGSGFGQSLAGQNADAGNTSSAAAPSNTGASSFTGGAGTSHSGRQGGQPQAAYANAYAGPEVNHNEIAEWDSPRRPMAGQVDMRA